MDWNLKVVQQNIKEYNLDIERMIDIIIEKDSEIVFLSEYKEEKHRYSIKEKLIEKGYKIKYPFSYDRNKDKSKVICLLAIKGVSFTVKKRDGMACDLRYIAGTIDYKNKIIEFLGVHIPQTYIARKANYEYREVEYYQDRVQYKAEMLFDTYQFMLEHIHKKAIIVGDFNTDIKDENTRFNKMFNTIYEKFYDTTSGDSTWGKKRLDYALVSKSLEESKSEIPFKSSSDHKGIETNLRIKSVD